MNASYLKGFTLTASGAVVLSFDAVLIRLIGVDSNSILFWRGLFLGLTVYLWLCVRKGSIVIIPLDRVSIRSASFFTVSTICFVTAINLTAIANVLVIISAQPLMAALLAHFILGEKSPTRTWIAIFLSMSAIAWVMKDSWHSQNLAGDVAAVLCALALAAKFVNDRSVPGRNMTISLVPAAFFIALFGLGFGDPLALQGTGWLWMLVLCVLVIPTAFMLITVGPMHIPAAHVAMLLLLETVFGPVWAWFFLKEMPSRAALEGGVLVLSTLIIHATIQWRESRNNEKHR